MSGINELFYHSITHQSIPNDMRANPAVIQTGSFSNNRSNVGKEWKRNTVVPDLSPLPFYKLPVHEPSPFQLNDVIYEHLDGLLDNAEDAKGNNADGSTLLSYKPNMTMVDSNMRLATLLSNRFYPQNLGVHNADAVYEKFTSPSMTHTQSVNKKYASKSIGECINLRDALAMSSSAAAAKTANSTGPIADEKMNIQTSDKPLKALSAYNFFFRFIRERVLNGETDNFFDDGFTPSQEESLLYDHWSRDRSQKRRHRKSHGKISFATLSRTVSQQWKKLPTEGKNFFKQVAAKDLSRYRRELIEFECSGPRSNSNMFQIFSEEAESVDQEFTLRAESFFDLVPIPSNDNANHR